MAKFQPGVSGNPQGRTKGIPNPATRLRQSIAEHIPAIITAMVKRARSGDTAAATLLLSRCLPPLRPESSAQSIKAAGGSLGERAEAVVRAAVDGEIPASAASDLMSVLAGQAKILETVELERRIAALEEHHAK